MKKKKANEEELEKLEADKETKEKALTDANANVEKEQQLLDEYIIEYDMIQEEIKKLQLSGENCSSSAKIFQQMTLRALC